MTKLTLAQATRLLDSMNYYLTDASVWTPEAIIEEAEIILEAASTDADFEYQIIDDGDGPIAIFNGIPGEVLDALDKDGYYIVNITEIRTVETNNATGEEPEKEEVIIMNTMKRMEELTQTLRKNQKTSDVNFIKKDDLRVILNEEFNMGFNNKATRKDMVTAFFDMYKDAIRVADDDEIAYGNIEAAETQVPETVQKEVIVPVGDLEITKDKVVIDYIVPEVKSMPSPTEKTNKLLSLIKANAEANNKKGYGYTISSFMLQACILNAGASIEKLKGHTVTAEEDALTQRVYKWLLKKEFIKPIIYSVQEDENVRIYMPEYTGRKDSTKTKLIPYAKSGGYTAKKVTSFAVKIK